MCGIALVFFTDARRVNRAYGGVCTKRTGVSYGSGKDRCQPPSGPKFADHPTEPALAGWAGSGHSFQAQAERCKKLKPTSECALHRQDRFTAFGGCEPNLDVPKTQRCVCPQRRFHRGATNVFDVSQVDQPQVIRGDQRESAFRIISRSASDFGTDVLIWPRCMM